MARIFFCIFAVIKIVAMTNNDIYNLLNFLIRKDAKGKPVVVDNMTRLLQQANMELFKEEFSKYQVNQDVSDSLAPFEVQVDVSTLTTSATRITLPTDYAHFIGMYWTDSDGYDRAFDLVMDDQWDMRCGSTLTIPTQSYPICKIVDDYIYLQPIERLSVLDLDSKNYVEIFPQIVLPEDYKLSFYLYLEKDSGFTSNMGLFDFDSFSVSGRSLGASFNNDKIGFYTLFSNIQYSLSGFDDTILYCELIVNNNAVSSFSINSVSQASVGSSAYTGSSSVDFIGRNGSGVDADDYYVWNVTISSGSGDVLHSWSGQPNGNLDSAWVDSEGGADGTVEGLSPSVHILNQIVIDYSTTVLYYIKNPNTPVYDYYIDVNGVYQYLIEGEIHTWVTGEKDSSGNTKTTGDPDYTSLTVESEWKDQDKLRLITRILRNLGVNLSDDDVIKYAQQQKVEQ